MHRILGRPACE